jgi:Glyoxalase-like domain
VTHVIPYFSPSQGAVVVKTLKYSGWTGKISRLGDPPASIMLQLVPERKAAVKNRAHLDFLVEDVAAAVAQVLDLGGSVVREPGFFKEPGNPDPVLEWAVLADPFGNEFCLIRELPEPEPEPERRQPSPGR